ncbi:MAG: hypothetical protein PVG13_07420 [Thiohalophilus sp.]|jgi:hypothetical protein
MNILLRASIRLLALVPVVTLLFACHGGTPMNVPADPGQRVLAGDRVQVARELTVPADKASIILQDGRIVSSADRFDASCRFVMKQIRNVPQKIAPEGFLVTDVRYWEDFVAPDYRIPISGGEMITFETTLHLHSDKQPDVHSLVCKHDDEHNDGLHLRLKEMQQAIGDFARLIKSEKSK